MKKEEILDLVGELESALERLEGRHDTLTTSVARQGERIHQLSQRQPIIAPGTTLGKVVRDLSERVDGAETQLGNLILSDARQGDRIDAVENHRDRIATPLIHKLIDRVAKLEENPADKAWAGRVQTQLDNLATADKDQRAADRRLSTRLEQHLADASTSARRRNERITALEDTYVKSANFADVVARMRVVEDYCGITPERGYPKPVSLYVNQLTPTRVGSIYLVFELWRSAVPHPCGGKIAPEKMLERIIVAPGSLVVGPTSRMQLDHYPNGYHWVVRDTENNIVAISVNTAPPDPAKAVKRDER